MNTEILHNEIAEPTLVQTENKKLVNKSEKVAERLIALREKLDRSVITSLFYITKTDLVLATSDVLTIF